MMGQLITLLDFKRINDCGQLLFLQVSQQKVGSASTTSVFGSTSEDFSLSTKLSFRRRFTIPGWEGARGTISYSNSVPNCVIVRIFTFDVAPPTNGRNEAAVHGAYWGVSENLLGRTNPSGFFQIRR